MNIECGMTCCPSGEDPNTVAQKITPTTAIDVATGPP
jgi:hypothetical protein